MVTVNDIPSRNDPMFAFKINNIRQQLNITADKFESLCCVYPGFIKKMEYHKGLYKPTEKIYNRIKNGLKLHIEENNYMSKQPKLLKVSYIYKSIWNTNFYDPAKHLETVES